MERRMYIRVNVTMKDAVKDVVSYGVALGMVVAKV